MPIMALYDQGGRDRQQRQLRQGPDRHRVERAGRAGQSATNPQISTRMIRPVTGRITDRVCWTASPCASTGATARRASSSSSPPERRTSMPRINICRMASMLSRSACRQGQCCCRRGGRATLAVTVATCAGCGCWCGPSPRRKATASRCSAAMPTSNHRSSYRVDRLGRWQPSCAVPIRTHDRTIDRHRTYMATHTYVDNPAGRPTLSSRHSLPTRPAPTAMS